MGLLDGVVKSLREAWAKNHPSDWDVENEMKIITEEKERRQTLSLESPIRGDYTAEYDTDKALAHYDHKRLDPSFGSLRYTPQRGYLIQLQVLHDRYGWDDETKAIRG